MSSTDIKWIPVNGEIVVTDVSFEGIKAQLAAHGVSIDNSVSATSFSGDYLSELLELYQQFAAITRWYRQYTSNG